MLKQTVKKKRPRTCVGCGEESPKRAMLRVVRSPLGVVAYDETGKANGRGAYVCCDIDCIKAARKKKALSRALKVPVSDSVYDTLELIYTKEEAEDTLDKR